MPSKSTTGLPNTVTAWQCIGCGRLEAPQNCIGVCEDRKVELVSAWDHAEALVALEDAQARVAALAALVAKLAHVTPREGAFEWSYRALQAEARALLTGRGEDGHGPVAGTPAPIRRVS